MSKAFEKSVKPAESSPAGLGWESVWRIVFPDPADPGAISALPLYAAPAGPYRVPLEAIDPKAATHSLNIKSVSRSTAVCLVQAGLAGAGRSASPALSSTRSSCTLPAGAAVGLCSYFNAFPASYWRFWTRVRKVRLLFAASGRGVVVLYKSNSRGIPTPLAEVRIDSPRESRTYASPAIPLTGVIDGGLLWADLRADPSSPLTFGGAAWQAPLPARTAREPGRASVVITTFNRVGSCLRQLQALSGTRRLLPRLARVRCIDQGTHRVKDAPGFEKVRESLGGRLSYVRQPNLGGSGGFSRGMLDTLEGDGGSALLLDDDARIEPEALLRAIQFEDYARTPLIVGAGMLHLDDPPVLYTQAERLNRGTLLHEQYVENHDFAARPLAVSPRLHRRVDCGYNGWWMSLIPGPALQRVGLALPAFLKFDDIDYGARAAERGIPTVSLPGVAIWHEAWHGKNETRSWQEYFNQRNRYLFALLHEKRANRRVPLLLLRHCTAMGLTFDYSGIALDALALTDLLKGPGHLVGSYPTTLARVRALRSRFPDAHTLGGKAPQPEEPFPHPLRPLSEKANRRLAGRAALSAWLAPQSGARDARPQRSIASGEDEWKSYLGASSALVETPDGKGLLLLRRDDRLYKRLTRRVLRLALRLVREWPHLHAQYARAGLGSVAMWRRIFAAAGKNPLTAPQGAGEPL